ncbi:MAG: hypothetical protein ABI665_18910 [Vicinamibacterales bacterium]
MLVEGGAAAQAADEFERIWRDGFALTWRRRAAWAPPSSPSVAAGDVPVRVLADEPGRRCTEQALVAAIDAAQLEVLITNQYAVPTPPVTEALAAVGRRGIDVQLIVPAASPIFGHPDRLAQAEHGCHETDSPHHWPKPRVGHVEREPRKKKSTRPAEPHIVILHIGCTLSYATAGRDCRRRPVCFDLTSVKPGWTRCSVTRSGTS